MKCACYQYNIGRKLCKRNQLRTTDRACFALGDNYVTQLTTTVIAAMLEVYLLQQCTL